MYNSSWNFHELISAKNKFHELLTNTRLWALNLQISTKLFRDSLNFKNILIDDFHDHPFIYRAKVFVAKHNKLQRRDNHSNIYLLFDILNLLLYLQKKYGILLYFDLTTCRPFNTYFFCTVFTLYKCNYK